MNSSESAMKPPMNAVSATHAMPTQTLRRTNVAIPIKLPRPPMFLPAGLVKCYPSVRPGRNELVGQPWGSQTWAHDTNRGKIRHGFSSPGIGNFDARPREGAVVLLGRGSDRACGWSRYERRPVRRPRWSCRVNRAPGCWAGLSGAGGHGSLARIPAISGRTFRHSRMVRGLDRGRRPRKSGWDCIYASWRRYLTGIDDIPLNSASARSFRFRDRRVRIATYGAWRSHFLGTLVQIRRSGIRLDGGRIKAREVVGDQGLEPWTSPV
jgi:hypothetical protein